MKTYKPSLRGTRSGSLFAWIGIAAFLSAFVADRASEGLQVASLQDCCGVVRVFLRIARARSGAISASRSSGH